MDIDVDEEKRLADDIENVAGKICCHFFSNFHMICM